MAFVWGFSVSPREEEAVPVARASSRRAVSRRAAGRIMLAGALPAILTACSSSPLNSFDLAAAAPLKTSAQPRRAVISIEEPNAPALLASNRIAIRRAGGEIVYLAGAQWSNVLTQLVQRRLIESFENAHLFQAVAETGTASDYILAGDIRHFEIDGDANRAVVEIAVRLIAARTGCTVQGTIVSGSAQSPAFGAAGITAALDQAFAEAAEKILRFAVSKT